MPQQRSGRTQEVEAKSPELEARVSAIYVNGKHGPYAVCFPSSAEAAKCAGIAANRSITFAMSVLRDGPRPDVGEIVVLGNLRRFDGGLRAFSVRVANL